MLTVKVNWYSPDFTNYSVYTADSVAVMHLCDGTVSVLLTLGTEHRDLLLGPGCLAFVMNDHGSTVDSIRVPLPQLPRI